MSSADCEELDSSKNMPCDEDKRSIGATAPVTRRSKEKVSYQPYQRRTVRPVAQVREYPVSGLPEHYAAEREFVSQKLYDLSRTGWRQMKFLLITALKIKDKQFVNTILTHAPFVLDNEPGDETLWQALQIGNVQIATQLVCSGTDFNRRNPGSGATYLHWLVSKHDDEYFDLATMMMDSGADIDATDKAGNSVMHVTVEFGLPRMLEELIKRNVNVDVVNKSGRNIVYAAAKGLQVDRMLPLIIGYSRDMPTRNKRCVEAFYALLDLNARLSLFRKLLDMKFPLDQYGRKGSTLLYEAVFEKKIELVKLLLEYGADINKKLRNGKLPLHAASQQKNQTIFKLLIKKGANIHNCSDDYSGQYPIHGACKHESLGNIKILLGLGADVNVVDKNGRSPFSLVSTENFTQVQACVIRYIALSVVKVDITNRGDLTRIRSNLDMQDYYEKCLKELETMKETIVHDDVSFFCLFNSYLIDLSNKLLNIDFMKNQNDFGERMKISFPVYYKEIEHVSRQIERAKSILIKKQQIVRDIPNDTELPNRVVELIASYSSVDEIKQMQRDYYISYANE